MIFLHRAGANGSQGSSQAEISRGGFTARLCRCAGMCCRSCHSHQPSQGMPTLWHSKAGAKRQQRASFAQPGSSRASFKLDLFMRNPSSTRARSRCTQHCGTALEPFTLSNLWIYSRKHPAWNHTAPCSLSAPYNPGNTAQLWAQGLQAPSTPWPFAAPAMPTLITPGTGWDPAEPTVGKVPPGLGGITALTQQGAVEGVSCSSSSNPRCQAWPL